MRLIGILFLLMGCGLAENWEARSIVDRGTACLEADAGGVGTITVDAGTCLSSSCDREATGTCAATVDGNTITVTTRFDWETATGNVECTDDCGFLEATCITGSLPAGDYTLVVGDRSSSVTVPTEGCEGM